MCQLKCDPTKVIRQTSDVKFHTKQIIYQTKNITQASGSGRTL